MFEHLPIGKVLVRSSVILVFFNQVSDFVSDLLALNHWDKWLNRLFEGSFDLISIKSLSLDDDIVLVHKALPVDHRTNSELKNLS